MTRTSCTALLLGFFLAASCFAENVILINGTVVDGSGKPGVLGSVRIRDGKVTEIGRLKPASGETVLDVKGLVVAPGFVDFEGLSSPAKVQEEAVQTMLVAQGATTALVGASGAGPYLVEEFMQPFDEKPPALNLALLVGHSTVRRQIMGPDYRRAATPDEMERMSELVSDAMKQGAFGLASDLQAEPASFSTPDELLALAKTAARFGGVTLVTLRNESDKLSSSVKEAIALSRDAKSPVQVLTTNKSALSQIRAARGPGINISADSYSFAQFAADKTARLERAVQQLSATPASRLGLRERGILKKGAPADIVVFDPKAPSAGMRYVFVNGSLAVKEGKLTEARGGSALR